MSGNSKPVILFLNHWARRVGGAEHSLIDILTYTHNKCACHIAATEHGTLIEKANQLGVTSHIVPCHASLEHIRRWGLFKSLLFSWWDSIAFFLFVIRLKMVVDRIKPHLIHANVPKSHMALSLLRLFGYKGICCFHMREIFKENSAALFLYSLLFPRKNGYIIAISQAVRNNLPCSLISKATVIYNGVYCLASRKEPLQDTGLKLLYLGRIVPWKGCHTLIDILMALKTKFPSHDISLSLVGDTLYWPDSYRHELQQRILSNNLSSSCVLHPHSDNPEAIYMHHDVFCNASHNEPFGRVIAEAQGCGLPVVAFNSGGVPEIVTHNETGLLIPPGETDGFVEALSIFVTHPDKKKIMGEKGRVRVERFFNKEKQISRIYSFLRDKIDLE